MNPQSIEVQHFVLAKTVSTFGAPRESNILGVRFDYSIPPDTEFPKSLHRPVVFARIFARDTGVADYRLRVHYEYSAEQWRLLHDYFNPLQPLLFSPHGLSILDQPLSMPFISLAGFGLYAITIHFRTEESESGVGEGWDDPDPAGWGPDDPGWFFGSIEYFRVIPQ